MLRKMVGDWLADIGMLVIRCPGNSAYHNPIGNAWAYIEKGLRGKNKYSDAAEGRRPGAVARDRPLLLQ